MALCKRVAQSGAHLVKLHLLDAARKTSSFPASKLEHARHISELASSKRPTLLDTLAVLRRLESQEVPTKQAEAIIAAINDSLESISHSFVSKDEMQKSELVQDSNLSKLKAEVQSSQEASKLIHRSNLSEFQKEVQCNLSNFQSEVESSQKHHFLMLERESEKLKENIEKVNGKLQGDIDKMRSDLRYEIDKATAGQRLDLNLERGRTRDELANQKAETTNLTNKLDHEIHALRAQVEAAKYDIIKYCIGTLVSVSAVGLALIRILL